MIRFIWLMLFVALRQGIFAQNIEEILLSHQNAELSPYNHAEARYSFSFNPVVFIGNTTLFFYQKVISNQIGATCAHEPSCSEYCRLSIAQNGFIRGVLLAGDRLHRCTIFNVMEMRKKPENLRYGKIYDPSMSLKRKPNRSNY